MTFRDPPRTPATAEVAREIGKRGAVSSIRLSTVGRPLGQSHIEIGAQYEGKLLCVSLQADRKQATLLHEVTRKTCHLPFDALRKLKRKDPEWSVMAECIRLHYELSKPQWESAFPIAVWRNRKLQLRADYEPRAGEVLVSPVVTASTSVVEIFQQAMKGVPVDYR